MRWWAAVEILDDILTAGSRSADEVEVYLIEGRSVSAELKRSVVSRSIESRHFSLSIRIITGGRIGTSSTSNPADWRRCLEAAVASGKLATPQVWNGLPGPQSLGGPDLSWDPAVDPGAAAVQGMLEGMVEGAGRHPVQVTSGSATMSTGTVTIANSHGIGYSRNQSLVSASLETIRVNSTGYEFETSCSCDFDPASIGDRAGFLAASSVNGKDIPTGTYDVILSPLAAAQLISAVLVPALSGRNVHAGRSKLAGSLGMQVADGAISVYDDPLLPRGLGSTRWDAEGTPTRKIPFIRDGILGEFAYDLKTAYRHGAESTGSALRSGSGGLPAIGHHNMVIVGPETALMDEPAVYIQDVVGAHTANPLSGDFSVELTNPFNVRDGSYETPIRKAMIAGNVFDLLFRITGLGRDRRTIGSLILPSIRLKDQHIIGV
ncbi:MAG: TldD/PmbA family protein [Methanomicrobiales archaeon]|nr:TldD/PmbA family protein [Methanomicrobiales archaeon]NYT20492.1 TldD/PmbA family protein [Methanomicrobiales archaeon]